MISPSSDTMAPCRSEPRFRVGAVQDNPPFSPGTFHSRTTPSSLPVASSPPSGWKFRARTGADSLLIVPTRVPEGMLQTPTVPSQRPTAIASPDGLKATAKMSAVVRIVASLAPLPIFHT